jgi:glutamine amidotransferase
LGIFNEDVKRFVSSNLTESFKIPQMGWNSLTSLKSPLMKNVEENSYCYFVHSYYVPVSEHTIAITDYIQPFSSALNKKNFYGVQFHTEKSAEVGEQILKNFLEI